jgi:hypothetical protein
MEGSDLREPYENGKCPWGTWIVTFFICAVFWINFLNGCGIGGEGVARREAKAKLKGGEYLSTDVRSNSEVHSEAE